MEGEGFEMVVILPLRRFGFVSFLGLISTLVTFAACSFGKGALSSGVFWLAMAKVCVVSLFYFQYSSSVWALCQGVLELFSRDSLVAARVYFVFHFSNSLNFLFLIQKLCFNDLSLWVSILLSIQNLISRIFFTTFLNFSQIRTKFNSGDAYVPSFLN
jgi:hypothetical protein